MKNIVEGLSKLLVACNQVDDRGLMVLVLLVVLVVVLAS